MNKKLFMKKDPKIFVGHIFDSILAIESHTKNMTKREFLNDIKTQDAVERRILILGEATKNLDDKFRSTYSDVDWKSVAGMRDVIVHQYFGTDVDLVWNTIQKDIPVLKKQIIEIQDELEKS